MLTHRSDNRLCEEVRRPTGSWSDPPAELSTPAEGASRSSELIWLKRELLDPGFCRSPEGVRGDSDTVGASPGMIPAAAFQMKHA